MLNIVSLEIASPFSNEYLFQVHFTYFRNMNTDSLRLLTSTQALADLRHFILSMNIWYGFNNPRWVTFGGSYSGALAAWFRQKYPEYTVGSVASSATVNLKLDFYGTYLFSNKKRLELQSMLW